MKKQAFFEKPPAASSETIYIEDNDDIATNVVIQVHQGVTTVYKGTAIENNSDGAYIDGTKIVIDDPRILESFPVGNQVNLSELYTKYYNIKKLNKQSLEPKQSLSLS